MNMYTNIALTATTEMEPRLFDLDLQLLNDAALTLIAVFVLYTALSYFLFNPVRNLLKKREEKVATELKEAADARESSIALVEEYEGKIADIQAEADEIMSDARKRALASENQIIANAKEEAHRIMERAKVEAELEKSKVADEVKQEMIAIASIMAGKVVAANITTDIQDGLIEETLKEMGEGTWLS
ncbi:MAG: F0F1 ATP synthase subunit B [Lachnospiraceae bacterium]